MHILVVEDDPLTGKSLVQGFEEAGHTADWETDGEAGCRAGLARKSDVIVLDLNLPGMDGMQVLKELRGAGVLTPVLLLTARGGLDDRIGGLDAGADDYLPKPFEFAELIARVNAVCRRVSSRPTPTLSVGDITLDLAANRLMRGDKQIVLTPIEFRILEMLMRYAGQVVTRNMLCEHVWGFNWDGTTNVVEVHVNRLRSKIDEGRDDSFIKTIRGRGYAIAGTI